MKFETPSLFMSLFGQSRRLAQANIDARRSPPSTNKVYEPSLVRVFCSLADSIIYCPIRIGDRESLQVPEPVHVPKLDSNILVLECGLDEV